jgi:hypothetical protein
LPDTDLAKQLPDRASRELIATQKELARTRRILNADELATLQERRLRLEKTIPKWKVYLFTLDGVLNGESVRGCLFAGQCIMVFGNTFREAHQLAYEGVETTILAMHEHYALQQELARSVLQHTVLVEADVLPGPGLNPHHKALVRSIMEAHFKGEKK